MKAVYIKEFGDAENLEFRAVDDLPRPQHNQVLVKVKASALNRADILQRRGLYPAPEGFPQKIPGLEFAGEVFDTGSEVDGFKSGDRVFGITAGGGQAELVLTDKTLLVKIPETLNFVEAAAVPEAFVTAYDAVFTQGHLLPGETLLIHAVGSGVGLAALQLAHAKGCRTFGTSRTADKLEKCHGLGLDEAILVERGNFAALLREKNGGSGVDVILDLVGAGYFSGNLEILNQKGRLILVGLVGGRKAEFDLGMALVNRLKIIGTVLRSRTTAEKAAATKEFVENVLPLFESGRIKPNVDRVFPAADVIKAHQYLESNESFGKVVLKF